MINYFIKSNGWLTTRLDKYLSLDFGWGNGYVIIPKDHPCYKMHYDDIHNKYNIQAHGGLTFCGSAQIIDWEELDEKYKSEDYWIVGFDTAHYGDTSISCPKEYVEQSTKELAEQFDKLWKNHNQVS